MPAVTVEDTLVLPRIPRPDPTSSRARPVATVVGSHAGTEGGGVPIRRVFPGGLAMSDPSPPTTGER
jgi:quercetin 2,3-dioxygenase